MLIPLFTLLLLASIVTVSYSSCANLGYCNGHGLCKLNSVCECFEGWGASGDITTYRAADCSAKVCPSGNSWGDLPDSSGETHRLAECSDKGICNHATGKCKCADGFEGAACQRLKCLNNCSGHGRCMTMERLASSRTAFPLSNPTTYQGSNVSDFAGALLLPAHLPDQNFPFCTELGSVGLAEDHSVRVRVVLAGGLGCQPDAGGRVVRARLLHA